MNLDSRKKVFDAGIFHSFDEFLVFLSGDELYEHRIIYFKCDNTIFPTIHKTLLEMEAKNYLYIETAKEEGFTGYFLLTEISRSALEKADAQGWAIALPRSLKNERLRFIEDHIIQGASSRCELAIDSNHSRLCKVMFDLKVGKPYEWGSVFDRVKDDDLDIDKKDKKRFQDAAYAVNKKVKQAFGVEDDLFSFNVPKHITRNF